MRQKKGEIYDERNAYQYAIASGDKAGQQEHLAKLKELGYGERQVKDAQKNAKVPPAHRVFKALDQDIQVRFLQEMSPEERREYLPLAAKKARAEFLKESRSLLANP